jgi:glutamyl-tRNA reductase
MSNLILVGLSHRTAEVAIRERAAFRPECLGPALKALTDRPGIREALILSTCNRVEVLCSAEHIDDAIREMENCLAQNGSLSLAELKDKLYHHLAAEAVRHVFRVGSSLDSMILGEPQILGQLKTAYGAATEAETAGPYLNSLMQAAFRVAKRIRTETSIGQYSVSVSSAAVELAGKVLGDLRRKSIFIIGAGKMGEVAVRHLASAGARSVRVTNRSAEAAKELAARFQGTAVPFEQMTYWLGQSDIVIVSTGAPTVLIDLSMAQKAMLTRKGSPIVFIDISVPRNVDPAVGALENAFCYDIDDLGAVVQANLQERRKESIQAEKLVDQEVDSFLLRMRSMDIGPIVVQIRRRIDEICRAELDRFLKRTGPHNEQQTEQLEAMIQRIAGKVTHPLVTQIRDSHQDPEHHHAYLETLKRIFSLQKDPK